MNKRYFAIFVLVLFFLPFSGSALDKVEEHTAGYILLQVESDGEAWYVDPIQEIRFFLGRPADAFRVMRELGIGITNKDLNRIPIGIPDDPGIDSDNDGAPDALEAALGLDASTADTDGDGYSDKEEILSSNDSAGTGEGGIDKKFAQAKAGRIFLQVEAGGEAWYVYPGDNRRYYLGKPADAFAIMRSLGKGISNQNLDRITAVNPHYLLADFSREVFRQVNAERTRRDLDGLVWNSELAVVASLHSMQLARENQDITAFGASCDYPVIHHEGLEYGPYLSDRLCGRDIYYYQRNGENIALVSAARYSIRIPAGGSEGREIDECQAELQEWNNSLKDSLHNLDSEQEKLELIQSELAKRQEAFDQAPGYELYSVDWLDQEEAAQKTVQGWLESPGHRENMLDGKFNEAGMGAAYVNGYLITTQVFITRAGCGYQTGKCCEKEGYYPYCFEGLECNAGLCVSD